ncbi:NAD-dependent epimerase/dehydratase family protein [Stieleria varia]|uniref:dTDP-glucose 4,6-dehydratase n=1 Tax=Stieleria varia TaxID=2528005 RepID=A0A5C6B966_9BACT|nr:NAD-dependent epimerase/dehydratase family protein [Stieleria varia]TWU08267.1 dTDP-glucose 4,6-dehydratase [Stieleria varia]
MRVFVTGATGLLGNTITRQLDADGHTVVALVRNPPHSEIFDGLNVEFVQGDLTDLAGDVANSSPDRIDQAIAGCDAVIHAAGFIHLGWTKMEQSMGVNVGGTHRIMRSCVRHDKKLVYVGTLNSIAVGTREQPADETTPIDNAGGQIQSAYVVSKSVALSAVMAGVKQGLRAVVVHPGFMLGPWDWKPSSGQMMLELSVGWKPLCPAGGCSICDSRDVAAATIRAIDYDGPSGRQFILAGENWTYKKLWTVITRHFDRSPPIVAPGPIIRAIGGVWGDLVTKVTGNEGFLNTAAVAMSRQFHWYSSERAKAELGYESRDAHESIQASVDWIRQRFIDIDPPTRAETPRFADASCFPSGYDLPGTCGKQK